MELKPSTIALAVTELFEHLESKYSVGQQVECKLSSAIHSFSVCDQTILFKYFSYGQ